jgi:CheY-like chemotaxis protein
MMPPRAPGSKPNAQHNEHVPPCEEFVNAVRPLVSVVDDDESVREFLPDLLRELGFATEAFSSAEEFLESDPVGRTQCLILDVTMPGMSGPEPLRDWRRGQKIPIRLPTRCACRASCTKRFA